MHDGETAVIHFQRSGSCALESLESGIAAPDVEAVQKGHRAC